MIFRINNTFTLKYCLFLFLTFIIFTSHLNFIKSYDQNNLNIHQSFLIKNKNNLEGEGFVIKLSKVVTYDDKVNNMNFLHTV
jgi:hypothetical protein